MDNTKQRERKTLHFEKEWTDALSSCRWLFQGLHWLLWRLLVKVALHRHA